MCKLTTYTTTMTFAADNPEQYADLQDAISALLLPFWMNPERPFMPLSPWLALFNAALQYCQRGQGAELTDEQKNRLLLDFMGEHGRQQLDLRMDVELWMDTMPHAAFLHTI